MEGKVVAITGCTTGCGFLLANTCAELRAKVFMLNRKSARADAALETVIRVAEHARAPPPEWLECDLQDFASVRACGAALREALSDDGLDVLCCNAGVMGLADSATKDGADIQMQTNHLAHFLLTKEVFPLLERAGEMRGEARIVQHSSSLRTLDPGAGEAADANVLQAKYLGLNGGKLGGSLQVTHPSGPNYRRYQQSKLANITFTYALRDRLEASGSKVKALCAHPGDPMFEPL